MGYARWRHCNNIWHAAHVGEAGWSSQPLQNVPPWRKINTVAFQAVVTQGGRSHEDFHSTSSKKMRVWGSYGSRKCRGNIILFLVILTMLVVNTLKEEQQQHDLFYFIFCFLKTFNMDWKFTCCWQLSIGLSFPLNHNWRFLFSFGSIIKVLFRRCC